MKLTFNTLIVDVSTTLEAINQYQSGNYRQAIDALQSVLDLEPNNWDARLMLGACYYKTGQHSAAHRLFQFIYEKTDDQDIRWKAKEGLDVCEAKLNKQQNCIPAEFGCHIDNTFKQHLQKQMNWM